MVGHGTDVRTLVTQLADALAHHRGVAVHVTFLPVPVPSSRDRPSLNHPGHIRSITPVRVRVVGARSDDEEERVRLTGMVGALAALVVTLLGAAPAGAVDQQRPQGDVRKTVFVGNNWDGTATVLAPGSLKQLGRINIIPDKEARIPGDRAEPGAARLLPRDPRGHRRGQQPVRRRHVLVQRRAAADRVAALVRRRRRDQPADPARSCGGSRSPASVRTTWRVSPNGKRVVVSASTGNVVHVLRMRDGKEIGSFPSGGSPHENIYIDGGRRILHASIGIVYTPADRPEADPPRASGSSRSSTRDDAASSTARRYNLRKKLDRGGLTRT